MKNDLLAATSLVDLCFLSLVALDVRRPRHGRTKSLCFVGVSILLERESLLLLGECDERVSESMRAEHESVSASVSVREQRERLRCDLSVTSVFCV